MRDGSKIEREIQVECSGRAPELIGYMAMSIRLSPSLTRAIAFAAKNMDGPISSGLKRVFWNIYTQKYHTVERSFSATAIDWGKQNEDLKRALFAIKTSTLEATDEGRERSLNKAMDTVLAGTRRKMEEFASSLSTPTTVLFALGILLPMMLGAMLPMISLGGLDLSHRPNGMEMERPTTSLQPVLIILLMDVVFPATAFLYASTILSKRPRVATGIQPTKDVDRKRQLVMILTPLGLTLTVLGVMSLDTHGPYLIIWSFVLPTSVYFVCTNSKQMKEREEIETLEAELPDALFQLGTRMLEGSPPEKAILETARSMKDARIAQVLRTIYYRRVVLGRRPLETDSPSQAVRVAVETFMGAASKDSVKAGGMAVKTSNHLKDMQRLEDETRRKLKTSTDAMRMTAMIFAPIVMGVTFSLYVLLVETFSQVGSAGDLLAPNVFLVVLGVYVSIMAAIVMYFVSGIERGGDRTRREFSIGVGLMVSSIAFTISSVAGQILIT